jgi:hypothetical protein
VNALIYVFIVTMQLGGIVDGHIEAITLPGHLSEIECEPGSGYAAKIVASSPVVRGMESKGWRVARWDCQRDVFTRAAP